MSDFAMTARTEVPEGIGWLRIARVAAFCSLSLLLIGVIVVTFLEARESVATNLMVVLLTAPFWAPYLWMLLQMKARTAKSQKKGLALYSRA